MSVHLQEQRNEDGPLLHVIQGDKSLQVRLSMKMPCAVHAGVMNEFLFGWNGTVIPT